ncbi:hypothetical protein BH23ACT6_BH23ACT6_19070 [soil metagenome]
MELLIAMLVLLPLPALGHSMIRAQRRRRRRGLWADSPAAITDEPFRGYKLAQLVIGERDAWLVGVLSVRYGVDQTATCLRRGCRTPGLDCLCGFYAFKERADALALLDELSRSHRRNLYVLLTADLDGDVLEYERGFRAQRQRIVQIEIADQCTECRGDAFARPPVASFVTHPRFRAEQLRNHRDLQTHSALPMGSSPLQALCGRHLPGRGARRHSWPELRALIGTEVSLLPVADHPGQRGSHTDAA